MLVTIMIWKVIKFELYLSSFLISNDPYTKWLARFSFHFVNFIDEFDSIEIISRVFFSMWSILTNKIHFIIQVNWFSMLFASCDSKSNKMQIVQLIIVNEFQLNVYVEIVQIFMGFISSTPTAKQEMTKHDEHIFIFQQTNFLEWFSSNRFMRRAGKKTGLF